MPNSGVFYNGGKFHVSKLASDSIEFIGSVSSATGIALADNQATGAGSESAVMPTATQIVDYVLGASGGSLAQDLAAQSATSVDGQAISLPIVDDATYGSLIAKLDQSRSDVVVAIKAAQDYLEGRINLHEQDLGFLDASGAYAVGNKLSATAIAQSAVQAFSFVAPSQPTLKADMEERFKDIHLAFDALAKASEDQDNVIEASTGLNADGTYSAHATPTSSIFSYADASGMSATALTDIDDASITNAKLARETLRSLIQQNHDNFAVLVNGAAVDLNVLTELVSAYQLADTEIISAITQIVDKTGLSIDTGLNDLGDQVNPVISVVELASNTGSFTNANSTTASKTVPATTGSASLRAAVELRSVQILGEMAAVQAELDDTQTGAGLAADGTYAAPQAPAVQYLTGATSLYNADTVLDSEIKVLNERLSDKHGLSESLLDGSFFNGGLASPTPDFALSASFNVVDGLNELASVSGSNFQALQDELDRTQASIGFDVNGANADGSDYSPALAYGANYFVAATPVATSLIGELDSFFAQAHTALKGFEAGTGLGHDGAYTANGSANYISTAVSLQDADNKLDAALEVHSVEIDNLIAATGMSSAPASKGAFVPYTGAILASAGTMYAADVALETELVRIAGDLYANPAGTFSGFTIAGGAQSTFEEAINALDTLIGDEGDLDVAADSGTGAVALATETYTLKGGASADAASSVNVATSWDNVAKQMSIILDANPKAVTFSADEKVQAPISSSKVKVHDAPMEASDVINAGDIIALDMSGTYTIANGGWAAVKRADKTVGSTDLSKIIGIAFDPTSVNGELSAPVAPATTFGAGDMVAFITEGVIKGFDLSGCTTPAAGQELYLDANGKVTNSAPSGDGSTSTDYVSIHKIGMIVATGATFADNVVMIDMKHIANDQ